MNQSQRNFLIEKIESTAKIKREALEKSIPEKPSLNNYLLRSVMVGDFEIISNDKIKELIMDKAMKSKSSERWMSSSTSWGSNSSKTHISFNSSDFFVIPEDYKKEFAQYQKKHNQAWERIKQLNIEVDTLITRIKLASNKTLESLISEIDDMGNISLIDTKLKQLTA